MNNRRMPVRARSRASGPGSGRSSGFFEFAKSFPPALGAALLFLIPMALVQVIGAAFLGLAFWLVYIIKVILYLLCGFTAGKMFQDITRINRATLVNKQRFERDKIKSGAGAGLTLGIITLALSFLAVLLMGVVNPWVAMAGGISIICMPVDIISGLFIGALGAKLS